MKIISAILAILILFLTMQPVLSISHLTAKENKQVADNCCTDKQTAAKHKKEQETNSNCCGHSRCDNPLLSCANCYFVNGNHLSVSTPQLYILHKKDSFTNDKPSSSYIQDVWHPPQIV